jgi:hypothetical protein
LRSHEIGALSGSTVGAVAAGVSDRPVRAHSHDACTRSWIAAVTGDTISRAYARRANRPRRAFALHAARRFAVARFVAGCAQLTCDACSGGCEGLAQAMPGKTANVFPTFGGELPRGTHARRTLRWVAIVQDAVLVARTGRASLASLTGLHVRDEYTEAALAIGGVATNVSLRAGDTLTGALSGIVAAARCALPVARARFPQSSRRADARCYVGHGRALVALAIRAGGTRRAHDPGRANPPALPIDAEANCACTRFGAGRIIAVPWSI